MSSQDFPGPSWQDRQVPDDGRSGYRRASEDSYRQPNAARLNQHGGFGRPDGHGSSGYGRTNGWQDHSNGIGPAGRASGNGSGRPDNGAYGPTGYQGNGSRSAGADDRAPGDRGVSGGRRVATGRHGGRGAGSDSGAPGDDTGAWYRPAGRSDSTRATARRPIMARRAARSDYYNPGDGRTGVGDRTERYGAGGPYGYGGGPGGPGRPGGPGGHGGPGGPGRGRGPRRGSRDIRALIDPDGQTPLPTRIARRLWYGRWWRHWSFKKAGLLFGALCATMALVLVATFFVMLNSTKVPISSLETAGADSSSLVYFSNGKQVGCFCTSGRFPLSESQIGKSKRLVAAVLAAEDRGFFTEGGISVTGLLRAAKNDLSGGSIQGGSTITEQFVKTYYDPTGNGNLTYGQKIKEIFVAIKLAKMEPKLWILTHYLNAIPLGSGANGVQAAAETYFHRSAWQLTVAQAAMIAAMIQAPYGYDPENPTASPANLNNSLLQRWIYVLTNMVRDGAITQARFNGLVPDPVDTNSKANLKKFPKIRPSSLQANWPGYRGYIMQLVANELAVNYHMNYTTTQLGNMGLQIHTTINERLMNALNTAVNLEKRQMAIMGQSMPSYVHISAVLEKPGTGKILAFYGGPGYGTKHCKRYHCNVNTILTGEPVGSSFKPYVLATAVSQGMDVRKSVLNSHSPLCIPPDWTSTLRMQLSKQINPRNCDTGAGYWVFDEGGENFSINLNPWQATAVSNDPAFEDLIHRTGVQPVINMAGTLGVSKYSVQGLDRLFGDGCLKLTHNNCHPGAVNSALGEGDLTAVDQANTFSVLVSGGYLVTPHIISSVTQNGIPLRANLTRTQAIPKAVAADTDYGLSFDTSYLPGHIGAGTGVPNAVWNRPMIAKTGTLGSGAFASQAWFVGAIPQYSLAVGMFTDKPNAKPNPEILDVLPTIGGWQGGYGGAWPATIWHKFMSDQFNNIAVQQLPPPSYTGSNPTFTKWVLALPPKKKHKHCHLPGQGGGGPGGGNGGGNGHHHRIFIIFGKQCPKGGGPNPPSPPSPPPTGAPSPPPTGSPSPQPTITITTPPPSGSPSPTASGTPAPAAPFVATDRQRVPSHTVNSVSPAVYAVLPNRFIRKPASVVTSSLV